jgi:hypothetical protein
MVAAMGDRGNIFFVDRREGDALEGIYMYTHWSGAALPLTVREALERGRGRWGDSQYLARIVFCELVGEAVREETGYGLSTRIGDNEHSVVRIDDLSARVSFHAPGKERRADDPGLASWSYEAYLAMASAELERAFLGVPVEETRPETPPRATAKVMAKVNGKGHAKGHAKAAPKSNGTARGANGKGKAKAAPSRKPAKRRAGAR